jgi:prevent-host-death family protein
MTSQVTTTELKIRLSAILDQVRDQNDRVVITRNGKPEAVIMALADLEVLEETMNLLATAGALDQLRQAQAGLDAQ